MRFVWIALILTLIDTVAIAQSNDGSAFMDFSRRFSNMGQNYHPSAARENLKLTNSNITIEIWLFPINLPEVGAENPIVKHKYSIYSNSSYELKLFNTGPDDDPGIKFIIRDTYYSTGGEIQILNSEMADPLTPGVWTHLAVTYDGNTFRIFINGSEETHQDYIGSIGDYGTDNYLYLGGPFSPFGLYSYFSYFYAGLIDELSIWSSARTKEQIQDDMISINYKNEPDLQGFWKFDAFYELEIYPGGFSKVAPDSSENHNDLLGGSFVKSNASDPPYGLTEITTDVNELNFGSTTLNQFAGPDTIYIYNNGNSPAYGFLKSQTQGVQFPIFRKYAYFIDPQEAPNPPGEFVLCPGVSPMAKGFLDGELVLTGNDPNLPLTINASVECTVPNFVIDANNIAMWILSDGRIGASGNEPPMGFMWPIGSGNHMIYSSGIWLGAMTGPNSTDLRVSRTPFTNYSGRDFADFRPGPIDTPDPYAPENHTYKITRGDDNSNPDYQNWPAAGWDEANPWGAPLDSLLRPWIPGDQPNNQTLFTVYNDQSYPEYALGAEVQHTVFAFNTNDARKDAVFIRFKVINKSGLDWTKTYLGLFCDGDLGDYSNDLALFDEEDNLGIMYNSSQKDAVYGDNFPALGYKVLRGALGSKPVQAFAYFSYNLPDQYDDPSSSDQFYNYLRGLDKYGNPYPEDLIDDSPGDKRFVITTGPFDLPDHGTRQFLVAFIASSGTDNMNAVENLRNKAREIETLYQEGHILGSAIENLMSTEISPGDTGFVDDRENSGAVFEIPLTNATSPSTFEIGTYLGAPPGAGYIESYGIWGVGSYLDVRMTNELEVDWPIYIKIYYTEDQLYEIDKDESDLLGIYYWDGNIEDWILYETTGVNDLDVDGYAGYVWAEADHLTMMRIGTQYDSTLKIQDQNLLNFPTEYSLSQNYPNPFNPVTMIKYQLPRTSNVTLSIYNTLGQKIQTLFTGSQAAGSYQVQWDASGISSGIYYYRIEAGKFQDVKKMILLR